MKTRLTLLVAGLLPVVGAAMAAEAADFHFALSRSAPAADVTVPAPSEVRLWFTEAPEESSVGIRLIDGSGAAIETGTATADENDGTVYSVSISRMLAAGAYTVSWRGIGDDGHPVRGDFGFSVSAQ